jgi:RNA polymerase primary sigma factor
VLTERRTSVADTSASFDDVVAESELALRPQDPMHPTSVRRSRGPSGSDSLATYLNEIKAYALLSRDEELELARRIRQGDKDALDGLVCANLRFVVSIAKRYQEGGVSLLDLINEGNLGLVRAARKFDDSKGVKFISYAVWWVRQAIVHALTDSTNTIRLPSGRVTQLYRIRRTANTLRQHLNREPTQDELASALGVTTADIEEIVPIASPHVSLDAPIVESDDGSLLDVLSDDDAQTPDDRIGTAGLSGSIDEALSHLRDREAQILRSYFGLDGGEPMTLEEIGHTLGVTRERVRQI